ncbi:MAG: two-component regulator propeller domain-containing protein [Acidobacteriota bacterium]
MKLTRVLLLAVLFQTLPLPSALALDPRKALKEYGHDVWHSGNGLPQNSVTSIVQTRDGYLWLGTLEGLVRFDGVQFTVFDKWNTPQLKSNRIHTLFEDREGSLWIGTEGGGLNRLREGKFDHYSKANGLSNDFLYSISEDSEGNLWISTANGLNRFSAGVFSTYTTRDGLASNNVRSVTQSRDGSLWFATTGGLSRLKDGKFVAYTKQDGLSGNFINQIIEDRRGDIWIATPTGLNRLRDGVFTLYTQKEGLSSEAIDALYEDHAGALWVATSGGGVNRLLDGKFSAYTMSDGLSSNFVRSIYEDREGSLWIGTEGGGLDRLRDGKFTAYTRREGLSSDFVWTLMEGRDGSLWVGTQGSGLDRIKSGAKTSYTTKDGLPSDVIRSLCEDKKGRLWVGTARGLALFQSGRFIRKERWPVETVRAILDDRAGGLWVGTDTGLVRMSEGRMVKFTVADGLSSNLIMALSEDREGRVWIGTWGGGVNVFKDGKFKSFTASEGLSANVVRVIYPDSDGNVWIGTEGGGLNRVRDGQIFSYAKSTGLFDDMVSCIIEDPHGNLWMSCNKGVFSVSKKQLDDFDAGRIASISCNSYGESDGMVSRECNGSNQPAGWRSRDGRIWFPTMKGAVVINPAELRTNDQPPPVHIARALVNGVPADTYQMGEFPRGRSNLEFHYSAPSFLGTDRIKFRYKLEGFDPDWSEPMMRREAYYTNIPPGQYRFRVIACNNDGVWNDVGASFEFRLKPHFYETWWFYLLSAAFLALLIFVGHHLRIRRMALRERRLAELVAERTRELEAVNEKLHQQAILDDLTGIANHRRFREFLDREWRRAARNCASISIVLIDVDRFKSYNDTYGHQAGDECLRRVAEALQEAASRATDLVARYGGEEFVAVLTDTDEAGAMEVAEKMRQQVESLNIVHTETLRITVSAGVASVIPASGAPDDLIGAADEALYQAKRSGRNQVRLSKAA